MYQTYLDVHLNPRILSERGELELEVLPHLFSATSLEGQNYMCRTNLKCVKLFQ